MSTLSNKTNKQLLQLTKGLDPKKIKARYGKSLSKLNKAQLLRVLDSVGSYKKTSAAKKSASKKSRSKKSGSKKVRSSVMKRAHRGSLTKSDKAYLAGLTPAKKRSQTKKAKKALKKVSTIKKAGVPVRASVMARAHKGSLTKSDKAYLAALTPPKKAKKRTATKKRKSPKKKTSSAKKVSSAKKAAKRRSAAKKSASKKRGRGANKMARVAAKTAGGRKVKSARSTTTRY